MTNEERARSILLDPMGTIVPERFHGVLIERIATALALAEQRGKEEAARLYEMAIKEASNTMDASTALLSEAEQRGMGRAKEAIAPFLTLAEHYLDRLDHDARPMRDDRPVFSFDTSEITVADLRRLRAALAGGEGE